jgi:hypothetical protein
MAIGLSVTDDGGRAASYHRITRAEYDFERMQLHIIVRSYADETYRAAEKEETAGIEAAAARWSALNGKAGLTAEESAELADLNIRELDACKYAKRHMREWKMTLGIGDDIRAALYGRVEAEIPQFGGGEAV